MKRRKIIGSLLIFVLFLSIPSKWILGEERNIYVGDLIQLRIRTQEISNEEIREKFQNFEIVDMKEEEDGYLITIRSFETGEKKIQLGDKEIVIDVKSTLDEIQREGIFEGKLDIEKAGVSMKWKLLLGILGMIFLFTGVIILWRYWKRRKQPFISPYQQFMNQMQDISHDDDHILVHLTFHFKQYLESRYSCQIRGKTSHEIIDRMKSIPELIPYLPEIQSWLEESDYMKYRGLAVTKESKQSLSKRLLEIVKKIEEIKEGEI